MGAETNNLNNFESVAQMVPEKELTFQDDEANNVYLEHLRRKE